MPEYQREDWRKLCEAAAAEQDPKRLLTLVERINAILSNESNGSKSADEHLQPPPGK